MDAKTLQYQAGLAGYVTDRNVEALTHVDSLVQPKDGGNCLNWNLGHLVRARLTMLQVLGADAPYSPEDYGAYDHSPVTEDGKAMNWDTLISQYRELQAPLDKALGASTQEQLDAKAPFSPVNNPEETVGSLLAGFLFHEAYHAGQIALGRRIAGKPGAISSPKPEKASAKV